MNCKTLKEFQAKIDEWIASHGGYWPPLSMVVSIMEELGEIAREINHLEGFKPKKASEVPSSLGEELADLMFSIICLANHYKIDLTAYLNNVIKKYDKRDKNRFI
ncbi:MAG: nucleotide pyrophosphohydrolase [Promethearchaeota archaeon]